MFWPGSCQPTPETCPPPAVEYGQGCDRAVSHMVVAPMPVQGPHGEVFVQRVPVIEYVCADPYWECRTATGTWGRCVGRR
jgi:hypothetical protein